MNPKEAKTGQSVDIVKATVLTPELVKSILEIPNLGKVASLIDVGSGDATSSRGVIEALSGKGYVVENLGLVDVDTKIFPDLIETVTSEPSYSFNTQVLESGKSDIMTAFLEGYEGKYDIALAQLVLQQIPSEQEASYLMYCVYRALKPTGELLLVDLHPKYIQYLIDKEPDKFEVLQKDNGELTGEYRFDSGGSVEIHSSEMATQLAMFLGLGFDLVKAEPIFPNALANLKERYQKLSTEKIPMFYLMQLRKNPAHFVSSTTGLVAGIKPYGQNLVSVSFADKDEVMIPRFNNWENVKPGSGLVLHEIVRPEANSQIVNYWVVDGEKVTGGQLVASLKD